MSLDPGSPPPAPPVTRWRLVLEYHGAGFVGWQVQPDGRSVQGVVQGALSHLLGHAPHVAGSGRTDAGVHALGQVAAFDTHVARSPRAIRDGLNAHLPDDVACVHAAPVASDFDPRRHARRKLYRYTWLDRRARSPLLGDRSWQVPETLDVEAMAAAAACLVGTHDFVTFRAVGCAARTTVRTLEAADVRREGPLVHLELVGNGFLRHMVRIVAGTLVEVGRHRRPIAGLEVALRARERPAAGRTAPPQGLTLVSVTYPDAPDAPG